MQKQAVAKPERKDLEARLGGALRSNKGQT